jgi:uncharacterized membrane protein YfcA
LIPIHYIPWLVLAGAAGGFGGGLLGLGGAFIMTPVQYAVYTTMGLPADLAIKMAFGTSLLVVLPTAISGTVRHHHKGAVIWRAAVIIGCCALVMALAGSTLAAYISGTALKAAFGVVVFLSGIRLVTAPEAPEGSEPVRKPWIWAAWAVPMGLVSGLFGVGGGIVMVPVMVLALRFKVHNAVATSLAAIIFASIGGVIGYIVNGIGVAGRPDYSLGYVNLPAWLALLVPGAVMAQVGAAAVHRLPRKPIIIIFLVVQFYIGLRMIGVFEWLGLPL